MTRTCDTGTGEWSSGIDACATCPPPLAPPANASLSVCDGGVCTYTCNSGWFMHVGAAGSLFEGGNTTVSGSAVPTPMQSECSVLDGTWSDVVGQCVPCHTPVPVSPHSHFVCDAPGQCNALCDPGWCVALSPLLYDDTFSSLTQLTPTHAYVHARCEFGVRSINMRTTGVQQTQPRTDKSHAMPRLARGWASTASMSASRAMPQCFRSWDTWRPRV